MSKITYKVIDLFAGTGAFSYVFSTASPNKYRCIFANDLEKSSETMYNLNHIGHIKDNSNNKNKNIFILKDLHDIDVKDIPKHNVLCGGFPCQPFSIAGQQKGFEDTRANVFWKILEIISYHQPEIILLENVKNLRSHDGGNTYKIICEKLTDAGYHIKAEILDTAKITAIPQHRERIYIVCFKDKTLCDAFDFNFPNVAKNPIKDYLETTTIPTKYYYTSKLKVFDTIKAGVTKHIDENVLYQYRRYFVRENKNGCCPTLTANMGAGGHNVPLLLDDRGIRKLTPRECFNLQGFPADYKLPSNLSDNALYKLAGNAISIPVAKLIVDKIANLI